MTGSALRLRYDAVLLDIDGTLVDSNGVHAAAWSDAFATYGRHHTPDEIRPLIGKGGDQLLRELASLDDESGEGKKISLAAHGGRSRVDAQQCIVNGSYRQGAERGPRTSVMLTARPP